MTDFEESLKPVATDFAKALLFLFKNGGGAAWQLGELIRDGEMQKKVFKDKEKEFKQFRGLLAKLVDNFNVGKAEVNFVAGKRDANFDVELKVARMGIENTDPRIQQRVENTHLTVIFNINTTIKTKRTTAKFKGVRWGHLEPDFARRGL